MIEERKIGEWSNPIVNEADRPNRSAADMKAIFDSNANELKDAFNGLIDDLMAGAAEVSFEQAQERENIESGDSLAVMFGKLAKFFRDAQVALNTVHIDSERSNRYLSEDGTYSVPEAGEASNGIPAGGVGGQHLVKTGAADYACEWRSLNPDDIGAAKKSVSISVVLQKTAWSASGNGYAQNVSVTGVFEDTNIIVSADAGNMDAFGAAGIRAIAQSSGSVLFYADAIPDNDVTALVLIVG